jgi:hypothetical protein
LAKGTAAFKRAKRLEGLMKSQCLIGGIPLQSLFNQAKHAAKGFRLAAHEQLPLACASING